MIHSKSPTKIINPKIAIVLLILDLKGYQQSLMNDLGYLWLETQNQTLLDPNFDASRTFILFCFQTLTRLSFIIAQALRLTLMCA